MMVDKFKDARWTPDVVVDGDTMRLPNADAFAIVHQYERVPGLSDILLSKYIRKDMIAEPEKTGIYSGPIEIPAQNDNLTEMVMGKTVALVGPAQSLKGMGAEIDAADVVVRMNRGFPAVSEEAHHCGQRTDILYHCMLEKENCGGKIPWKELKEQNVFVCSPYPDGVHPFNRDIVRFHGKNASRNLPFHAMQRNLYLTLAKAVGTRPNTGICAIVDLLAHRPASLKIYGMDFFATGWRESYKVDPRLPEYIATEFGGNHHQEPQKALVDDLLAEWDVMEMMNSKADRSEP